MSAFEGVHDHHERQHHHAVDREHPTSLRVVADMNLLDLASGLAAFRHGATIRVTRNPQQFVDVVGDVLVLERQGVCVVAKRRRGVPVPEALLGPQQFAPSDEERGHAVTQAVQASPRYTRFGPQLGEPVTETPRRQSPEMGRLGGEEPFAQQTAKTSIAQPAPMCIRCPA